MIRRAALGAVGVVVLALGGLVVPTETVVDRAGNDYLFVAYFGGAALVVVAGTVVARAASGPEQATPPTPETVPGGSYPGSEIDDFVERGPSLRRRLIGDRPEIRDRLRTVAIRTEMLHGNCSRIDAVHAVESGEWTDDPVAAAFLAGDGGPSLWYDAVFGLVGESPSQRRVRRTARAILDGADEPHGSRRDDSVESDDAPEVVGA